MRLRLVMLSMAAAYCMALNPFNDAVAEARIRSSESWSMMPSRGSISVPPVGKVKVVLVENPPVVGGVFIPPAVWDMLLPPGPRILDTLTAKIPNLDRSKVREITADVARLLLDRTATYGISSLELFSDSGLLTDRIYYVSEQTIMDIDRHYDIHSLFLFHGMTERMKNVFGDDVESQPFGMRHLVMGGGQVRMLYNFADFDKTDHEITFRHPQYKDHGGRYTLKDPAYMEIKGPGHVNIHGVEGPWNVAVKEFIKMDPNEQDCKDIDAKSCVRIKLGSKVSDQIMSLDPIVKR